MSALLSKWRALRAEVARSEGRTEEELMIEAATVTFAIAVLIMDASLWLAVLP